MRVFRLWRMFDKHQLAIYCPQPSYREMEGVLHLDTTLKRIDAAQLELDRKNRPAAES